MQAQVTDISWWVSKQFVFYVEICFPSNQIEVWKSYLSHVSVVAAAQVAEQQPPFLKIHEQYFSSYSKDDTGCKSITHVQTPLAPEQAALVPHIQSPL